MAITIRKLDIGDMEMADSFDCGDQNLNEYLKRYAVRNQGPHMFGVTYAALSSEISNQILGYYTLANSSISRDRMPEEILKGLPKYADIPAILIGRFAVDKTFAGRGVGHILMSHALTTCLAVSQLSAARYILTLAYQGAITWYRRYSFQEIPGGDEDRRMMYLDLTVVRDAQEIGTRHCFRSRPVSGSLSLLSRSGQRLGSHPRVCTCGPRSWP
jgi:GNAT superfamily N-acetyltransferase